MVMPRRRLGSTVEPELKHDVRSAQNVSALVTPVRLNRQKASLLLTIFWSKMLSGEINPLILWFLLMDYRFRVSESLTVCIDQDLR